MSKLHAQWTEQLEMLSPGSIYTSRQPIHPACQPILKSLNKVATELRCYALTSLVHYIQYYTNSQSSSQLTDGHSIVCMHSCMQGIFPQHQHILKWHFPYGHWSYFTHYSRQHQALVSKISLNCLLICTRCVYLFFLGSFSSANMEHQTVFQPYLRTKSHLHSMSTTISCLNYTVWSSRYQDTIHLIIDSRILALCVTIK